MRTQKIKSIKDVLKTHQEDELVIQPKINGTLGIYYKIYDKTFFKTRIGINFKNIPKIPESIPDATAFLSIISTENEITVIDTLVYSEESVFTKTLSERIEYTNRHCDELSVLNVLPISEYSIDKNYVIKSLTSKYKLSNQSSNEYSGDWFTIDDNSHDVIVKSFYINDNQKFFRCFQLVEGKLKKVCNITVDNDRINRKLTHTIKNNKRAVITIHGTISGDKIKNPQFIALKKNKPFNSVISTNDRMFSTLEIITIGDNSKNKFISNTADGFSTQRRIIR